MLGLENRGKTLIFMSRHFDKTMTIFDFAFFSVFGALKTIKLVIIFVLRINQRIYYKPKNWMFLFILVFFPSTFPAAVFPIHFAQGGVQVAYG